jgi:hypothetical protein
MRTEQRLWTTEDGWKPAGDGSLSDKAQLVLVFGGTEVLRDSRRLGEIAGFYPGAEQIGCSTAGEIRGTHVTDDTIVVTALALRHTTIRKAHLSLAETGDSCDAGRALATELVAPNLEHVLVFSDGLAVNGSELTRGFVETLPPNVQVTGGLAGDGTAFEETLIVAGAEARPREVVAVGFYGDRLRVGFGSLGGWDPFGPQRLITRSKGNVLYELDGRSALELYKQYLGDYADDLPASALLFPLSLRSVMDEPAVVRTVLSIDEAEGSMTFAGDLPEGWYARLMKANFERLIDGANDAATTAYETIGGLTPQLALLISCVGRKMVLRQRIEEEVESVQVVLGEGVTQTGFYSYGEIAPCAPGASCELHNQTMTITTLTEV